MAQGAVELGLGKPLGQLVVWLVLVVENAPSPVAAGILRDAADHTALERAASAEDDCHGSLHGMMETHLVRSI